MTHAPSIGILAHSCKLPKSFRPANRFFLCRLAVLAALLTWLLPPSHALLLNDDVVETQASKPDSTMKAIQDNSFLIEEAYNQESGVVQHISAFTRFWNSKDWAYTFTQEWPLPRRSRHQLSYTAFVLDPGEFAGLGAGFGDFMLNYRYQVLGNGEARVAFAPRLSLLLPSGDHNLGRGFGGVGVQANLPLSLALGRRWVTHLNAGTTFVPRARNAFHDRARATGYNVGQSVIWLAHPRVNLLVETAWTGSASVVGPGKTEFSHDLLVSPGIRWSFNFRNGLQIVPGLAVPVGVGPSAGERGLIIYVSFEHPLWRPHTR